MCDASSAMLKGRGSCAISERPTHSPFVSPSLLPSLTPLFPLDTSHSPASPLFPLDTQNRGVHPPSNMTNRSISAMCSLRPVSPLFLGVLYVPISMISVLPSLFLLLCPQAVNCQLITVNCLYPLRRPMARPRCHIRLFSTDEHPQPPPESTLSNLHEIKQLHPPLESTLSKKQGGGVLVAARNW